MFYVYILKSKKNGKLYKGFTSDLRRRVKAHNSGNSEFTSKMDPGNLFIMRHLQSKRMRDEKKNF